MSVAVIIPTFRRPDGLKAAVESVQRQSRPADEIIIVDNAPEGCARSVADAFRDARIHYLHVPEPGVANARNAGLAMTEARYIAFLDDDEIASEHWLAALLHSQAALDVAVVFGPLQARTKARGRLRQNLLNRLYSRPGPDEDQRLDKPYGCGNSLIDRNAVKIGSRPFDTALNETGGEDDAFFAMLQDEGARFGWASQAHAIECVDPRRAGWTYMLSRSFAFGQGPSQTCAHGPRPDWLGVARWMAIGVVQLAVFAPLAVIVSAINARQGASFIDRTAQAAGKICWFDRFSPRFYGRAAS
ncbi:glycosyltransferase family 2 protein [Maricaulis sp.]|uniref:glycosyltransferase family 2 protein n=1 Tax=Maricaulis sp. TaxID=1486257 RepID=UPI002601683D|nr:glycosyltransferase family 2 protein [Maricaulis sp.]